MRNTVSFAIATYNSDRTLERCLTSIRNQDYDQTKIEIVIADGGSKDSTLDIAKKFSAKIKKVPNHLQNAEYNKGVAVNASLGEIIALIDHDNILPDKKWLSKMLKPLNKDKKIFGSGVLRFKYDKSLSLLDRYFSLFGVNDPSVFYFNKSAHQSYIYDSFHLRAKMVDNFTDYFKVKLDPNSFPALGGNGALVRRNMLRKANVDPKYFFHIDVHLDLAKKGFRDYAFVKESVLHLSDNKVIPFLKRRMYFMEKYYLLENKKRRYLLFNPKTDKIKLLYFVIISITIVIPLIDSFRGYRKIRDVAWFLHPIMCLAILFVYGIPIFKRRAYGFLEG